MDEPMAERIREIYRLYLTEDLPLSGARDEFVDLGTLAVPASASKSERIELRLDLGGGMMLHLVRG